MKWCLVRSGFTAHVPLYELHVVRRGRGCRIGLCLPSMCADGPALRWLGKMQELYGAYSGGRSLIVVQDTAQQSPDMPPAL